jgi:glycosyltransferase involved in cell wall biosynthesis
VAEDDLLVVTVARLARQKALDVLLDAVALLPGVKLAIVGDGPLRTELEQHAATIGVAERVRFVGRKEEVGDYIAAADVFALSSSWEARALAAQEAILLKVPVVTTDVGGMSEIVTDGVSGRLVPAGDPAAFARALADVLGDRDKARRWGEAAAHQLDAGFSTEAMLKRLSDEYRKDGDD